MALAQHELSAYSSDGLLGHTTLAMVQTYVHIESRMSAQVSQDFSPMGRFEMQSTRRYQHSFSPEGWQGRIYPDAGGTAQRGGGVKSSPKKR